jgi:hypothetical protein
MGRGGPGELGRGAYGVSSLQRLDLCAFLGVDKGCLFGTGVDVRLAEGIGGFAFERHGGVVAAVVVAHGEAHGCESLSPFLTGPLYSSSSE